MSAISLVALKIARISVRRVNYNTILSYRMAPTVSIVKLESNAANAEKLLETLKKELTELRSLKAKSRAKDLETENESLRGQVADALNELVRLETLNGKKQIPMPNNQCTVKMIENLPKVVEAPADSVKIPAKASEESQSKEPKQKKPKAAAEKKPAAPVSEAPIDVGRLDMRIGRIIEVAKHPDAESLYVEKVDCGEPAPRTVVSGLVNHIPLEEMQNRLVVLLCNLKPAKMRGVTSEAMVMCASSKDKVEILSPPAGSVPGDLVQCDGYPRVPDAQLNPKKKIFETCAPDLLTNANKEACFKDTPLIVAGKGRIVSQTLSGVNVR